MNCKSLKSYFFFQVDRDVMIWNNKTFKAKPMLVKEDSLIAKYRRWFAQFYSENSPKLSIGVDGDSIESSVDTRRIPEAPKIFPASASQGFAPLTATVSPFINKKSGKTARRNRLDSISEVDAAEVPLLTTNARVLSDPGTSGAPCTTPPGIVSMGKRDLSSLTYPSCSSGGTATEPLNLPSLGPPTEPTTACQHLDHFSPKSPTFIPPFSPSKVLGQASSPSTNSSTFGPNDDTMVILKEESSPGLDDDSFSLEQQFSASSAKDSSQGFYPNNNDPGESRGFIHEATSNNINSPARSVVALDDVSRVMSEGFSPDRTLTNAFDDQLRNSFQSGGNQQAEINNNCPNLVFEDRKLVPEMENVKVDKLQFVNGIVFIAAADRLLLYRRLEEDFMTINPGFYIGDFLVIDSPIAEKEMFIISSSKSSTSGVEGCHLGAWSVSLNERITASVVELGNDFPGDIESFVLIQVEFVFKLIVLFRECNYLPNS